MSASAQRVLARIGRWPRRIAALACLLLAAGSALLPDTRATPARSVRGIGAQLRSGEVAVPVPIGSAGIRDVRPGDRIGVLAAPADTGTSSVGAAVMVADHLRVVSVRGAAEGLGDDASAVVVVATSRARALQLARFATRPLVLIADNLP